MIFKSALTFGAAVLVPQMQIDIFAVSPALISFLALYFLKADVLLIGIGGALCGLLKYFLT